MKTLLVNGKVYLERETFAEAVLVEDGRIARVGGNEELRDLAGEDAEVIDCQGKTVVPGFNDSHMHLMDVGRSLYQVKIGDCKSIGEMIERCRAFIAEHPERVKNGLQASGWNQDLFEDDKRMPNRFDLDKISTEIPIALSRVCHHITVTNTKAIEMLGMDENTPQIPGGEFWKDENGYPNGIFAENAASFADSVIPPLSEEGRRELLFAAMDYAVAHGLTSVQSNDLHSASNLNDDLAMFRHVYAAGEAKLRYRMQTSFDTVEDLKRLVAEGKYGPDMDDSEMLTMGPVKLFKDGSLGGRTAYMREDYVDDPGNVGIECRTEAEMDTYCTAAREAGLQVATHVIGDRAVEETLNCYERALVDGKNKYRNSLVHCQITDMALLKRIADLGVLTMVQPVFLDYDMTVLESRCGKELASTSYAFGTMDRLGVAMSFGTDSPVEDCNPFWNLYAAVTRKTRGGQPEGGFYPQECVDIYTAVDAYTQGSAYAEFMEDKKGRLKEGYFADLTVLDQDIFTVDPMEIKDILPVLTMVDGKVVYKSEA